MNKLLIYTFRTFPHIDFLKEISPDVIILDKLKEDINHIEEVLVSNEYSHILGIAKANRSSKFETTGVNIFNKGKVMLNGKDSYNLSFPEEGYRDIGVNRSYTTSFCNWGIYRVSEIIDRNDLKLKHSFVHIQEKDLGSLKGYLGELLS